MPEIARYVVEELRDAATGDWRRIAYAGSLSEAFRDRAPSATLRVLDLETASIIHPTAPARPGLARWYPKRGKGL